MLTSDHLCLLVIAGKGTAANDIMNRNAIRTPRIGVPSPYSFMGYSVFCWRPVTSFTTEVNSKLAEFPLVFNGRLANRGLTSLITEPSGAHQGKTDFDLLSI